MSKLSDHLPYAVRQFDNDIVVHLRIFGIDASITTSSTAKILTVALLASYLVFAMRERSLVPGRLQMSAEALYPTFPK